MADGSEHLFPDDAHLPDQDIFNTVSKVRVKSHDEFPMNFGSTARNAAVGGMGISTPSALVGQDAEQASRCDGRLSSPL
jgi:hypothetical protein